MAAERPAPRAGPSPLPVFAVIARPAQPVEAIPPAGVRRPCETGAAGRSHPPARRRSCSKQTVIASRRRRRSNPLCETDAAGRSHPPPAGVRRPCETGAAGRSHPLCETGAAGRSHPLCETGAAGRSHPLCRCSPSLRDRRSRSKPSPLRDRRSRSKPSPLAPPPNECAGRLPAYAERAGAASECAVVPSPSAARGIGETGAAGVRRHCETGAAGRSHPLCETGAAGRSHPLCETGAAGRSHPPCARRRPCSHRWSTEHTKGAAAPCPDRTAAHPPHHPRVSGAS
ncbi:MAG: hypothetical protein KatS3mg058_3991 [Roseiflexus sp.]|nr:MAG: hypothetical protein KatS3mg058_3991 [Roseiflexus sp.]